MVSPSVTTTTPASNQQLSGRQDCIVIVDATKLSDEHLTSVQNIIKNIKTDQKTTTKQTQSVLCGCRALITTLDEDESAYIGRDGACPPDETAVYRWNAVIIGFIWLKRVKATVPEKEKRPILSRLAKMALHHDASSPYKNSVFCSKAYLAHQLLGLVDSVQRNNSEAGRTTGSVLRRLNFMASLALVHKGGWLWQTDKIINVSDILKLSVRWMPGDVPTIVGWLSNTVQAGLRVPQPYWRACKEYFSSNPQGAANEIGPWHEEWLECARYTLKFNDNNFGRFQFLIKRRFKCYHRNYSTSSRNNYYPIRFSSHSRTCNNEIVGEDRCWDDGSWRFFSELADPISRACCVMARDGNQVDRWRWLYALLQRMNKLDCWQPNHRDAIREISGHALDRIHQSVGGLRVFRSELGIDADNRSQTSWKDLLKDWPEQLSCCESTTNSVWEPGALEGLRGNPPSDLRSPPSYRWQALDIWNHYLLPRDKWILSSLVTLVVGILGLIFYSQTDGSQDS